MPKSGCAMEGRSAGISVSLGRSLGYHATGVAREQARTLRYRIRRASSPELRRLEMKEKCFGAFGSDFSLFRGNKLKFVLLLLVLVLAGVPLTPLRAQGPQRTSPNAETKSIRNQKGIEMVWIPSGSFTMGSTDAQIQAAYADAKNAFPENAKLEWFSGEKPRHQVTIREGFYMGIYEVTQAQWRAVMGTIVEQKDEKAGPGGRRSRGNRRAEPGRHITMVIVSGDQWQER